MKSEVNHVGWDNATTYAQIVTDENGKANTPYLPYGQYLVKETATPKDYITAPDFLVSVTDDYSEYKDVEQIKRVNINNRPFTSQVRLIKVDKDTNEIVTLNSASFKIKDSNGNYVTQKVSGKKYDIFTTNSKNQITVLFGNKGEVTLPLALDAGNYNIEEIETPEGFLSLEEPVKFTISNIHDYDKDEDEDPIITIKVKNEQPKGKIILKKMDKVTNNPLVNVEYELTAKEDIISAIDGSILFKKGNLVIKGITDTNGEITIDSLFMGHYELKETLTNAGYVLSEEVHDIVFEQNDLTTKEYTVNIDVTNIAPTGEIHLVKTDKDTKELLSGVTYQLTAKENICSLDGRNTLIYAKGETVSKDISEDGLYITNELGQINIANLPLGKYEIKEVSALEGYVEDVKAYEIDLSYDKSDKTIYTKNLELTNAKTTVEISKKDISTSEELAGAELTLFDKDNNVVESWTSTNEPHIIRGLLIDKEYRLHEDIAPLGYIKASDVTFTVQNINDIQKIEMIDDITRIEISKQDITNNKELAGATLQIIDLNNQIIHEWISSDKPEYFEKLPVGEYTLKEITAPNGFKIAEEINFSVKETGEIQKVIMKDQPIEKAVKTGDSSHTELYFILLLSSLAAVVIFYHYTKKKENEADE